MPAWQPLPTSLQVIKDRARAAGPCLVAFLSACLTAFLVCRDGIPQLRQDWAFSPLPDALAPSIGNLFQPWLQTGIGSPQADPTAYLIGFALRPFCFLPPTAFVTLLVFGVAFVIASGGVAIGRSAGKGGVAATACCLFALFNPWVYTEYVAGHIWMLLSYGFLLFLAAEMCSGRPRLACLTLLSGLLICQIEFFLIAVVPLSIWLVRRRLYLPMAAACATAIPIAFGIAGNYRNLLGTPYLLVWQRSQSLEPLSALTLRGYFTHYASSFAGVSAALWFVAITGALSVALSIRMRNYIALSILAFGFVAAMASTGTKWVLAPLYDASVLHIVETGVFRELYDLLAFLAVSYVAAIALLGARFRWSAILSLAAASCLLFAWIATPPSDWFVPVRQVQVLRFPADDAERIALFPPAQPLQSANGRGSGYDPDLFVQQAHAIPVNSFLPEFPQSRALSLAQRGNVEELSALGVGYVFMRDNLREDDASLRAQGRALGTRRGSALGGNLRDAYPIMGLLDGKPYRATVASDAAGDAAFFGDLSVRDGAWYAAVEASREWSDPRSGWVDARLSYDRYPQAATRFGGAFTTSSVRALAIPRAPAVLAWTSDTLFDTLGATIATRSSRIRWWLLRGRPAQLVCRGACIVSAVGRPPLAPADGPHRMPKAVRYDAIAPWLVTATIPAHRVATLRWAVRYEPSWILIGSDGEHVRLAQSLNAWVLGRGPSTKVYILNTIAMVQFILEILAAVALCALIVVAYVGPLAEARTGSKP